MLDGPSRIGMAPGVMHLRPFEDTIISDRDVTSFHQPYAPWRYAEARPVFKGMADQSRRLDVGAAVAPRGFGGRPAHGDGRRAVPAYMLLGTPATFMLCRLAGRLWLAGVQHRMVAPDDMLLLG
jgi:hypothetical protein